MKKIVCSISYDRQKKKKRCKTSISYSLRLVYKDVLYERQKQNSNNNL